jgi:hypothetical protein
MFGLSGWTIGDPMTTEMEAIDAAVRGDGEAVDRALEGLDAPELDALRASAVFLADCCEMAARSRR